MSGSFGTYDFGLSAEKEMRAARLHAESIVVDMLFQGPCGYLVFTPEMDAGLEAAYAHHQNSLEYYHQASLIPTSRAVRGDFPEFKEHWFASGVSAGNRQVYCGFSEELAAWWGLTYQQFDSFPWLIKATHAADFRQAKAEGKIAGYVTTQNSVEMGLNVDLLDALYGMGLRMVQLTYNSINHVGAGCTERTDAGVSLFGVQVIERLNALGMIVDTAHCGRQTTLDACSISKQPVVASHTTAEALYPADRAKSDEELRAIASTGGVIGVCAVPFFLGREDVTVDTILDHIDYIVNLVGWQHAGIGTDWPLQGSKAALRHFAIGSATIGFRPEHNVEGEYNPIGFDDYRDFPNFTRGLVKRGYDDEQIRGILGENYLRVFEQVCG